MKFYRYTTNGKGVWSEGKRLLPQKLIDEVNSNRSWLKRPDLPKDCEYVFLLTQEGKDRYENSLYETHRKYLENIVLETYELVDQSSIVYRDKYQVVITK